MTPVSNMWQTASTVAGATLLYYRGLTHYLRSKRQYADCNLFKHKPAQQLHIYSLALTIRLWNSPHYRAPSFAADVRANLANVAIPGSGIPLSVFCTSKLSVIFFIVVAYPVACLAAMFFLHLRLGADMSNTYEELLLEPKHWFAIWRLNSLLVAQHEYLSHSRCYSMEDKGRFLIEGEAKGVAVSPVIKLPALVAKHAKVEGGMAIHFFNNFLEGGDWILQPAMHNSAFIASLLPANAPLSTLRIITASRQGMKQLTASHSAQANRDVGLHNSTSCALSTAKDVEVATVVFRAGRAGAATDHVSVCFDVDRKTGVILQGTSNQHWYQLGLRAVGNVGESLSMVYDSHPDTNRPVAGQQIPEFDNVLSLVKTAHVKMVPDVPLVGWDVALTDNGMYLLELNISCNFFNGSYDRDWYVGFMADYFKSLDAFGQFTADHGNSNKNK